MEKYLECGKIINTHGVRGDVKIEPWTDSPEVFCELEYIKINKNKIKSSSVADFCEMKITKASVFKNFVICHFEGIDNFDLANSLRNMTVYADRADIPCEEGAHFIADLIGLPLIDADSGVRYGVIRDVINRGSSDLYDVDVGKRDTVYFPAVKEFVVGIELENAVYIRPPKGIFDDDFIIDEKATENGDFEE